jgi:hypothetical protein
VNSPQPLWPTPRTSSWPSARPKTFPRGPPGFDSLESIEEAALELAKIHGPRAVLAKLLDQQRLGIEWTTIHRIKSLLMPGKFEIPRRA